MTKILAILAFGIPVKADGALLVKSAVDLWNLPSRVKVLSVACGTSGDSHLRLSVTCQVGIISCAEWVLCAFQLVLEQHSTRD